VKRKVWTYKHFIYKENYINLIKTISPYAVKLCPSRNMTKSDKSFYRTEATLLVCVKKKNLEPNN